MTEPTDAVPAQGTRWIHRNGAPYTVLMIANSDTEDEARYPVTVVYQGDNGKVWSRPASDWHRSMTATTPQPTQAQAGAVPLTDGQAKEVLWAEHLRWMRAAGLDTEGMRPTGEWLDHWLTYVRAIERAHGIGVKGGQHGAE